MQQLQIRNKCFSWVYIFLWLIVLEFYVFKVIRRIIQANEAVVAPLFCSNTCFNAETYIVCSYHSFSLIYRNRFDSGLLQLSQNLSWLLVAVQVPISITLESHTFEVAANFNDIKSNTIYLQRLQYCSSIYTNMKCH